MLCFTSLGAQVDRSINVGGAPYIFKMNGVVCHCVGQLLPAEGATLKFAQLYMVDSADEVDCRLNVFDREEPASLEPDPKVVSSLINMLNAHHRLVHKFRIARQSLCTPGVSMVSICFLGDDGGAHGTRFSGPTVSEVAALIVGDLTTERRRFDVIAKTRSGSLKHISSLNCNLMALQYPLLFPYGDKSYHRGIRYVDVNDFLTAVHHSVQAAGHLDDGNADDDIDCASEDVGSSSGQVTMLQYYKYYAHYREGEVNPYTSCGRG